MASLVKVDRPRRGWRQIEVTPADKGTAIIDPHRHASIVADAHQRPKGKRAVRRRHCGTVEALTARSKMTTQAVTVAIDAGHFGMHPASNANVTTAIFAWRNRHHHTAAQMCMIAPGVSCTHPTAQALRGRVF
jgi:hypothetical protein